MSSVIVDAVEDIRSLLQAGSDAGSFIFKFEAETRYDTDLKLEVDDALHVDLKHAPNDVRTELETQNSIVTTFPVLIGIRKYFGQSDQDHDQLPSETDLDQLVEFTNQISRFVPITRLTTGDATVVQPGEIVSVVPQDELRTKRQFFAAVRVLCRATEEL